MSGFGFKKDSPEEKLTQVGQGESLESAVAAIQPTPINRRDIDVGRSDAAAVEGGFTSREAIRPVSRKKIASEPAVMFSMRLPISVQERFARFADKVELSYPKALAALLDKVDD